VVVLSLFKCERCKKYFLRQHGTLDFVTRKFVCYNCSPPDFDKDGASSVL